MEGALGLGKGTVFRITRILYDCNLHHPMPQYQASGLSVSKPSLFRRQTPSHLLSSPDVCLGPRQEITVLRLDLETLLCCHA